GGGAGGGEGGGGGRPHDGRGRASAARGLAGGGARVTGGARPGVAGVDAAAAAERVRRGFADRFGGPPAFVVRAPGRVNLLGEHTDYNDGFVLPMAIDLAAWIAARPRADGRVVLRSLDLEDEQGFALDALQRGQGR